MYIYILKNKAFAHPNENIQQFILSTPGELSKITENAFLTAQHFYGNKNNLESTYEIVKLQLTEEEYKDWRIKNQVGTFVSLELKNAFLVLNSSKAPKEKESYTVLKRSELPYKGYGSFEHSNPGRSQTEPNVAEQNILKPN